jgi:hypothetical protein
METLYRMVSHANFRIKDGTCTIICPRCGTVNSVEYHGPVGTDSPGIAVAWHPWEFENTDDPYTCEVTDEGSISVLWEHVDYPGFPGTVLRDVRFYRIRAMEEGLPFESLHTSCPECGAIQIGMVPHVEEVVIRLVVDFKPEVSLKLMGVYSDGPATPTNFVVDTTAKLFSDANLSWSGTELWYELQVVKNGTVLETLYFKDIREALFRIDNRFSVGDQLSFKLRAVSP